MTGFETSNTSLFIGTNTHVSPVPCPAAFVSRGLASSTFSSGQWDTANPFQRIWSRSLESALKAKQRARRRPTFLAFSEVTTAGSSVATKTLEMLYRAAADLMAGR